MPDALPSKKPEPQWAAFVALDWGDQKHYWKLQDAASPQCRGGELDNTPEALESWAADLAYRYAGGPIAVCLEQSRGAVVYQLSKYPHLVLFPVHSTTSARFRQAIRPSGSKSDAEDCAVLLDLLLHHRDCLRRLDPDSAETRLLQLLVEQRRTFVNERTRHSNRLTNWLKMYFPQVLDWIDNIDSPLGCDFLERWPTLEQLQHSRRGTVHEFFLQHNSRSEERIEERIAAMYAANPAVRDKAMLDAGPMITKEIVGLVRALNSAIEELDKRIEKLTEAHPDKAVFANVPGAGPALLPRLIVAFGTKRERYQTAAELQRYSGIAPVTEQSGKTRYVHVRRACPKFLRQTFHEFAGHSLNKSAWARAFYDQKRSEGQGHHAAVRALAYKWIRVLFRCWKSNTPYDEQKYVQALQKRHAPLVNLLGTGVKWKNVAGFQKLCLENS